MSYTEQAVLPAPFLVLMKPVKFMDSFWKKIIKIVSQMNV